MRIVSLFDLTGYAVQRFTQFGHETIIVDNQHTGIKHPRATVSFPLTICAETELDIMRLKPDLILSFPPCTDLAVSGAAWFEQKRAADPSFQEKAAYLARTAERIGNALGVPWMVENPVSRLATLWRKPDAVFNPYQYGGYLPENDVHPEWPEYIKPRDAYPKKTCFWFGNGFTMPRFKPVPVMPGYSDQHNKLGGGQHSYKEYSFCNSARRIYRYCKYVWAR